MTLGQRIRKAREKAGFTQGELAAMMGYPYGRGSTTIGSWERDRTEPSRKCVAQLAKCLGVASAELEGFTAANILGLRELEVPRVVNLVTEFNQRALTRTEALTITARLTPEQRDNLYKIQDHLRFEDPSRVVELVIDLIF